MSNYQNQGYPGQYTQPNSTTTNLNKPTTTTGPGNYPGTNYPPQQQPQTGAYPPQQQQQQQQQGYPPQQNYGYPPQQQQQPQQNYGYPPQQQTGYPPQQNYGYPPQAVGYTPPQTGYPGMNSGAYGAYSQTTQYGYGAYGAGAGYTAPGYSSYNAYPTTPSYGYGTTTTVGITPVITTPIMTTPLVADVPYAIHLKGSRLDRKDVFSKSDPFITVSVPRNPLYMGKRNGVKETRSGGGSTANWLVIHRSETIRDNQNPVWQPFTIGLHTLCGGNLERPIKVECFDYDANGNHDKIGSGVSSIRELQVMKELRLINKKRLGIGKCAGTIEILKLGPQ